MQRFDAGSSTSRMAQMFPGDRDLTAYTDTLSIAVALLPRPSLTVCTLGGRVRGATQAEVDAWALITGSGIAPGQLGAMRHAIGLVEEA
jgi:DeoR/GlpR family transcriptional regulator of sugar metabolism